MPPKDNLAAAKEQVVDEDALVAQEWQEYMSDFLPADMTTVFIAPGEYFELFVDVEMMDTYMRGAFFTAGTKETSSIDVYIVGPRKQQIRQFLAKDEGIMRF